MLAISLAVGIPVLLVVIAMAIRKRCPHCHHRGIVRAELADPRVKRVRCLHCKAEFAVVDGGYVPIKRNVVVEEKAP